MSAMNAFAILPASSEDLEAIARISLTTFMENPKTLAFYIFSHDHSSAVAANALREIQFVYRNAPNTTFSKLVNQSTGEIAGFSIWQSPHPMSTADEEAKWKEAQKALDRRMDAEVGEPVGTDTELLAAYKAGEHRMRDRHVDPKRDYVLSRLAVLPKYQGQGCGSLLLREGLRIVDEHGARAWLEATPAAKPLYERFNWREIDAIVCHVEKRDGSRTHVTCGMLRDGGVGEVK